MSWVGWCLMDKDGGGESLLEEVYDGFSGFYLFHYH